MSWLQLYLRSFWAKYMENVRKMAISTPIGIKRKLASCTAHRINIFPIFVLYNLLPPIEIPFFPFQFFFFLLFFLNTIDWRTSIDEISATGHPILCLLNPCSKSIDQIPFDFLHKISTYKYKKKKKSRIL